jgi:hypothetical protein
MRLKQCVAVLLLAYGLTAEIVLAEVDWTDWQTHLVATSTISGSAGSIDVSVTGAFSPAPQLGLSGETNWWGCCLAAYSASSISAPTTSDMIRLTGGPGTGTYTLRFSQPVTNPVMAIASLGGASTVRTTFVFDTPFTILKTGIAGAWGLGTPLGQTGTTLDGKESNGLIQFQGTVSTITWTLPTSEVWFGFTVGVERVAIPPVVPTNLIAGLEWEYPLPPPEQLPTGFRLYRGTGAACDQLDLLTQAVADIATVERTYIDPTVPVSIGPLCYELTAFNDAGESLHSNRALIQAETLFPAVPTGVTITVLSGG